LHPAIESGAGSAFLSAPGGAPSAQPDIRASLQASGERPAAGSGDVETADLPGECAAAEPALTAQGSDGRRGSGGGRRGSGSSLRSRQLAGSELTFGAMLPSDGRRRSGSQAEAALSRLPLVEDVAAEVQPLHPLLCSTCSRTSQPTQAERLSNMRVNSIFPSE
jgi:hypothetical protein